MAEIGRDRQKGRQTDFANMRHLRTPSHTDPDCVGLSGSGHSFQCLYAQPCAAPFIAPVRSLQRPRPLMHAVDTRDRQPFFSLSDLGSVLAHAYYVHGRRPTVTFSHLKQIRGDQGSWPTEPSNDVTYVCMICRVHYLHMQRFEYLRRKDWLFVFYLKNVK